MKQIFEWLREEIEANSVTVGGADIIGAHMARVLVNQAEAKWEADCCEWYSPEIGDLSFAKNHPFIMSKEAIETFEYCPFCGKPIKISEVE